MTENSESPDKGKRLDGWQEIADHFKVNVRTVQRYEAEERLPVHRRQHRGRKDSVYAFVSELVAWEKSRDPKLVTRAEPQEESGVPPTWSRGGRDAIQTSAGGLTAEAPDAERSGVDVSSGKGSTTEFGTGVNGDGPAHPDDGWTITITTVIKVVRAHRRATGIGLLVLVLVAALVGARFFSERDGFLHIGEAGFVKTDEDVTGVGPDTSLNRYLVIEPQTFSRERFVQAKLQTRQWRVPAQFGERDTPDGTRFRAYVLVTSADFAPGKITTAVPQDATEFFATIVTLKK
jgi:hypothetical protein